MLFLRKYLIGSVVFHVSIILALAYASSHSRIIRKKFIVFGAHSKRQTDVIFKTFNHHKDTEKKSTHSAASLKQKSLVKKVTKKTETKPVKKTLTAKKATIKKEETKKIAKKEIKKIKKVIEEKMVKNIAEKKKSSVASQPSPRTLGNQEAKKLVKKEKECVKNIDQQEKEVEGFHIDLTGQVNKEMLVYQKRIQQEVQRLWRPPLGVPKGTVCTLLVEVGRDGKIIATDLVDRSNVLIYDLSVMKVAKKFAFHKSLWGKQFKIDFRQ